MTTNVWGCWSQAGAGWWVGPASLAFAADAGALAALGGEDVGVAGAGVVPAQIGLQPPGRRGVIGVVSAGDDEGA